MISAFPIMYRQVGSSLLLNYPTQHYQELDFCLLIRKSSLLLNFSIHERACSSFFHLHQENCLKPKQEEASGCPGLSLPVLFVLQLLASELIPRLTPKFWLAHRRTLPEVLPFPALPISLPVTLPVPLASQPRPNSQRASCPQLLGLHTCL